MTCVGSPWGSGGGNRTDDEKQRGRGQRSEVSGQVVNVTENTRAVTRSVLGATECSEQSKPMLLCALKQQGTGDMDKCLQC